MPIIINNKVLLTPDEKRHVEDNAIFLLDSAGIKKPPVLIMDVVRSAIPYSKVTPVKDTPNNIKGYTVFGTGICDISFNQNYPRVAQRFTVGHELGHALEKESGCRLNKNDPIMSEFQERRADYWAACLLMPEGMIRAYWNIFPPLNTHELYINIERLESRVAKLASIFEVSRSSMIIQLKDFGLIPVDTYFKLYKPYRNWID
jgi:Zn-dependent peptidase ImmA (M78 family)